MTLRDELAAVLGPGNNDQIAYEQADSVIEILRKNGVIADAALGAYIKATRANSHYPA